MPLSARIMELLRMFRHAEADNRRGPRFADVALALEQEMRSPGVSKEGVIECFGAPDLWGEEADRGLLVYFFDHEVPGRNAHEWYFQLAGGSVTNSGYNQRGINDLSYLKSGSEWPLGEP